MVNNLPANGGDRIDTGLIPGGENPMEGMASHFSILAGESYGQRSLAGYGP